MSDIYGRTLPMPLARYDREELCWKTCEITCLWALPMSLEILPVSGMTLNGVLYELPMPVRHIDESGFSSLLPTPMASAGKNPKGTIGDYVRRPLYLNELVPLLPTPTASRSDQQLTEAEYLERVNKLEARGLPAPMLSLGQAIRYQRTKSELASDPSPKPSLDGE